MDARLIKMVNQRPETLKDIDLPLLAEAIVSCIYNEGSAFRTIFARMAVIRLKGPGYDITVRSDDWEKILPYINDGTFDPKRNPIFLPVILPTDYAGDPRDRVRAGLYSRVLATLRTLFPETFPTSNL